MNISLTMGCKSQKQNNSIPISLPVTIAIKRAHGDPLLVCWWPTSSVSARSRRHSHHCDQAEADIGSFTNGVILRKPNLKMARLIADCERSSVQLHDLICNGVRHCITSRCRVSALPNRMMICFLPEMPNFLICLYRLDQMSRLNGQASVHPEGSPSTSSKKHGLGMRDRAVF